VLAVSEHFFMIDGLPSWALLLTYRPLTPSLAYAHAGQPGVTGPMGPSGADAGLVVGPDERPRYEALRRWRADRARQDGKPAYVIFTNNQLLAIARRAPTTLAALGEVPGVGDGKLEAFGGEVVALLAAIPVNATPPLAEAPLAEAPHG
jgi:ATP-dependent DNA helicase RecQ